MFSPEDLKDLAARGIRPAEAERQLALFKNPPAPANLVRPCTAGDGILRLSDSDQNRLEEAGRTLLNRGRVTKFVPASGAATRMFKDLQSDPDGPAAKEALANIDRFAFAPEIADKSDKLAAILARYASRPKALIPFHRYDGPARTAFEEQLQEARTLGVLNLHFTVSKEHRADFETLLEELCPPLEPSFSEQKPSTDTLAADEKGNPFRDAANRLVFRPGGHGALLENLSDLGADLVLIKNIDNITHARLWDPQLRWKRILLGLLMETRATDRPSRVCGVVQNTGEPGGGPFWISRNGKADAQIVESAQMNLKDPAQAAIFKSATHFNPVDLACSLKDANGKSFDLRQFRDDSAVFISQKSKDGKPLQALELPGLWNGAMAEWKTVFVEVPLETFNPVKTVNDLLKPAHQPA